MEIVMKTVRSKKNGTGTRPTNLCPDVPDELEDAVDDLVGSGRRVRLAIRKLLQCAWEEGFAVGYDEGFLDGEEESGV